MAQGPQATGHGSKVKTRATFRVVSAGSAVMLTTDPGTAQEMVTLFHQDDDALMATHYDGDRESTARFELSRKK